MDKTDVIRTIKAKNGKVVEIYQVAYSKEICARLIAGAVKYADSRNERNNHTLWDALQWAKQYEVATA